ncbi:NAD(+) synthase [soil metagenome]
MAEEIAGAGRNLVGAGRLAGAHKQEGAMSSKQEILELSRQARRGPLSPWFDAELDAAIEAGVFLSGEALEGVTARLIGELAAYREQAGVGTAVLGMSGGVDSALTAALLKKAGWRVIGFTLPIEQDPEETERGVEACGALGLEHRQLDLTEQYRSMVAGLGGLDAELASGDAAAVRTRRGNVRARLRMITLYDQAHRFGGLVASTDNFSELAAGFWTLHGDVGDLAPVQALLKSWEVPWMARAAGVPERTWRAKPTDGLGIGEGDEAQIGATYLEFDLAVAALGRAMAAHPGRDAAGLVAALDLGDDEHARGALDAVLGRLRTTWFKRINPITLHHPAAERYALLEMIDAQLFRPQMLRADAALAQFSGDLPDLASRLVKALRGAGMRIVTAESFTAGMIAACIAEAPGSSHVLEGSIVTYCASMKTDGLGVPGELIERETPYHPEVARRMAVGALERAGAADLALSVTGVGGPGPDRGKPAGLVYIAAARRGREPVLVEEHRFEDRPRAVLASAARAALALGLKAAAGADD